MRSILCYFSSQKTTVKFDSVQDLNLRSDFDISDLKCESKAGATEAKESGSLADNKLISFARWLLILIGTF